MLGVASACLFGKRRHNPNPGVQRHSLIHDREPDCRFAVQVRKWNIGSLGGRGEIYKEVSNGWLTFIAD